MARDGGSAASSGLFRDVRPAPRLARAPVIDGCTRPDDSRSHAAPVHAVPVRTPLHRSTRQRHAENGDGESGRTCRSAPDVFGLLVLF